MKWLGDDLWDVFACHLFLNVNQDFVLAMSRTAATPQAADARFVHNLSLQHATSLCSMQDIKEATQACQDFLEMNVYDTATEEPEEERPLEDDPCVEEGSYP